MPELIIGLFAGFAIFGGVLALSKMIAASPRAALAVVIGVTIGLIALIAQWPALLVADVVAMLILGALVDALRRRTLYVAKDQPSLLTQSRLALLNSIRKAFNQPRIWLIPDTHVELDERAMQTHAARLVYEIDDALKCSPLPPEKYASFERQTRQVPGNLNRALWKLARLRRLAESIDDAYDKDGQQHQELDTMTHQLHDEMRHSLEIVSSLSISLVKVELAHDDLSTDRLLADLNDSNQRLRDLSTSYLEVKEQRAPYESQ
ncbi:MAG TPA: hypothetical protein VMP08_23245 [Anaerolineae bacterium]|nr:hypothetical protein [Anaerolineae bacterium]